jgi:hypothetical protein
MSLAAEYQRPERHVGGGLAICGVAHLILCLGPSPVGVAVPRWSLARYQLRCQVPRIAAVARIDPDRQFARSTAVLLTNPFQGNARRSLIAIWILAASRHEHHDPTSMKQVAAEFLTAWGVSEGYAGLLD